MSFNQYISHPATTDDDEPTLLVGEDGTFDNDGHLRTVADRMKKACQSQQLSEGTSAEIIANVVGLTHDFAKLTSWAQNHLRGQPFKRPDAYRYHSFPSALVTRYCLEQCRDEVNIHASEIATIVVAGHHNTTAPPDPAEVAKQYGRLKDPIEGKYERVSKQFKDIDEAVSKQADQIIKTATNGTGSWEAFLEWHSARTTPVDGAHDHLKYFARIGESPHKTGYYEDIVRVWTALKFADQTAASGLKENDLEGILPPRSALEKHVADLEEGSGILRKLNTLRDQARIDATKNVESLVGSDDVGLITLPTGFGKTYAGLSAGLKAADIEESRLVYVLPYTSILDQTAREIQNVFSVSPYSKEFTLHHHLSDTYTGLGGSYTDADIGRSPGALHAESWLSGLTLTTTVQLFESLTAPTARQATRIPALNNAVIVIDEPQTIPESWWQIVPVLIELLVTTLDATVILMTATQPGLIQYGSDRLGTRELINNTEKYTAFLDEHPRVTYHLHETIQTNGTGDNATIDYPAASQHILDSASGSDNALAICNTRASAEALYRHVLRSTKNETAPPIELGRLLHEHAANTGDLPTAVKLRELAHEATTCSEKDTVYAFLSGNVRPDDRALIIDALYDEDTGDGEAGVPLLDTDLSVVLISTTVVEAGVDISFDTVYRDYAPIPNIVQSGGRCNRSFGSGTGDVIVWQLAEPEDGNAIPSLVIHGSDGGDALPLIGETGRVLKRHSGSDQSIDEASMVSSVVSDFYESILDGPLDPGKEYLATAIKSASISTLENEHMIQGIESYEDVIAVLTADEQADLLSDELSMGDISKHPGSQVNTNPNSWEYETTIGNSRYLVMDARDSSYHPVYGVQ